MTVHTAPASLSDLVLFDLNPAYSRDRAVLASGNTTQMGAVLARVAGKVAPLDVAGVDGAKVAYAVALEPVDASAADRPVAIVARGAALSAAALVWPAGITDEQRKTALDELEARGLVTRTPL